MTRQARRWTTLAIVAAALALVGTISLRSGRIAEGGGLGYDGVIYAQMTTGSLAAGSDNARMRPLPLLVSQFVHRATGLDVIPTFQLLNVIYAGLLALLLVAILDRYAVPAAHKAVFLLNAFATIAVVKMFAFDPVLIDPAGYVFVACAVYAILHGQRPLIALSTIAAVAAREFALVPIAFGIHRDLRQRVPLARIAATYAPALAAFVALRQWVVATSTRAADLTGVQGGLLTWSDAVTNAAAAISPLFLGFLGYFVLTVFGGVSLLVMLRAVRGRVPLHGETEWITYAALIVLLTAAGNADIWRYLAYGLPLMAVLYARAVAGDDWKLIAPWTALATMFTQQPWARMNDTTFFEHWLPLYLPRFGIPDPPTAEFWSFWVWRIGGTLAIGAVMWVALRSSGHRRQAAEDWRVVAPWGAAAALVFVR